jgi:pimeloyl-ACP methyl ester carboxylesterase
VVDKKELLLVLLVLVLTSLLNTNFGSHMSGYAQTSSCYFGVITPAFPKSPIPIILIHGYFEDYTVWSQWEALLKDNVPYCTVSFKVDDQCGWATDHAKELSKIVQKVKNITHQEKVNIVGHSKGGLDARVYLAQSHMADVANLIMIGTPNGGSPLADFTVNANIFNPLLYYTPSFCTPALYDLVTDAPDTRVRENPHTNYFTIYGDWNPSLPCGYRGLEAGGYSFLSNPRDIPNDGIVPKWSVEKLNNFTSLGSTSHCHTDLLNAEEYNLSKNVLISSR